MLMAPHPHKENKNKIDKTQLTNQIKEKSKQFKYKSSKSNNAKKRVFYG